MRKFFIAQVYIHIYFESIICMLVLKGGACMEMKHVSSSNVDAIGYEDGIIQVRFKNGSVYQYFNCNESLYHSFLNASSKGRFVHQHLVHKLQRKIR